METRSDLRLCRRARARARAGATAATRGRHISARFQQTGRSIATSSGANGRGQS